MQGENQYRQKCILNLQFLAVKYDMGVLIFAFEVV